LWFGDYVDFGDFETAVTGGRDRDEAAFSFTVRDLNEHYRGGSPYYSGYRRTIDRIQLDELSVKYVVGAAGEKTVMRRIELRIPQEDVKAVASWEGKSSSVTNLTIDGQELTSFLRQYELRAFQSDLFSAPYFLTRSKDTATGNRRYAHPGKIFSDELFSVFSNAAKRNLSKETVQREVRRFLTLSRLNRDTISLLATEATTATFERLYLEMLEQPDSDFSQRVALIRKADRTFKVLDVMDDVLTDLCKGIGYLGPARAASERYYRRQELEVAEISPDGQNFPMFLASLSTSRLKSFSNWVESIFGYGVELLSSAGHISINLKAGSRSVNVTDTGYGVSQILPVLGAIWWAGINPVDRTSVVRRTSQNARTLCIEQPELHLHPAHQSKLADVLVGAVSGTLREQRDHSLNLVIETHSEALINRLGELIADGGIDAEQVQIVVFSAEDDINSPTEVSVSTFSEDGVLSNWPFGFFNY
jgi:hypothetical protein